MADRSRSFGDTPTGARASVGVVDLKYVHDVKTELKLTGVQVQILEFVAEPPKGERGRVPWSWEQVSPATRNVVADLINRGLRIDQEMMTYAGTRARTFLRLTDKGRSVVAELSKTKIVASSVKPFPSEI